MTFAGIDFSTRFVDVVLLNLDNDQAAWLRLPLHGQDAFDKARSVHPALPSRTRWEDAGVVTIAVEEPMASSFRSAVALGRVQGAILASLPAEMPVLPLKPHEWKMAAGLPGNAKKTAVDELVTRLFPPAAAWEQDARDAYTIAWAARHLSEQAADRQAGPTSRRAA